MARRGFTLTESLVVIALITVLLLLGLAVAPGLGRRRRDDATRARMAAVDLALVLYKADHGFYPLAGPDWDPAAALDAGGDPVDPRDHGNAHINPGNAAGSPRHRFWGRMTSTVLNNRRLVRVFQESGYWDKTLSGLCAAAYEIAPDRKVSALDADDNARDGWEDLWARPTRPLVDGVLVDGWNRPLIYIHLAAGAPGHDGAPRPPAMAQRADNAYRDNAPAGPPESFNWGRPLRPGFRRGTSAPPGAPAPADPDRADPGFHALRALSDECELWSAGADGAYSWAVRGQRDRFGVDADNLAGRPPWR